MLIDISKMTHTFRNTDITIDFPSNFVKGDTCDMKILCMYAKALYNISLKAEGHNRIVGDGSVEVVINSNLIQTELKLSPKDIDIIKGIIMANGHTYYEI